MPYFIIHSPPPLNSLRYNLHTIRITHFKGSVPILVYLQFCQHHHNLILEHFSSPQIEIS